MDESDSNFTVSWHKLLTATSCIPDKKAEQERCNLLDVRNSLLLPALPSLMAFRGFFIAA